MFLLSKTCYSLLAFARFEWLLSVLFCFRWNYSVSHFYDVSKKPSLALSFSVLLCQATLFRQSHICICSFLFRLLSSNLRKNTSQVLVFSYCYSWVFLSISFVFLSIVSRFLCNFLDVMQFSRCNLLLHIFSDFFVSLRRPFNHIFVYALSSSPRLPRTLLKLFCKRTSLFGNFLEFPQKCLQYLFEGWTFKTKQQFIFSLERRWSSRTFRYGYLVTTSPQSLSLP